MGKTIVLNSTHWNKGQKKFIYTFPSNQNFKNSRVALQGLSIYNSFFNVDTNYNNTKISYNFLGTDYDVTLASGNYSVSDLNYALQQAMYSNKHY